MLNVPDSDSEESTSSARAEEGPSARAAKAGVDSVPLSWFGPQLKERADEDQLAAEAARQNAPATTSIPTTSLARGFQPVTAEAAVAPSGGPDLQARRGEAPFAPPAQLLDRSAADAAAAAKAAAPAAAAASEVPTAVTPAGAAEVAQ